MRAGREPWAEGSAMSETFEKEQARGKWDNPSGDIADQFRKTIAMLKQPPKTLVEQSLEDAEQQLRIEKAVELGIHPSRIILHTIHVMGGKPYPIFGGISHPPMPSTTSHPE
jgi:hypothetical protein